MKKIVFLINTLDSGGAERVVSLLLDRFIEKYDCYLILIHNNIFYKIDKRVKIINLNDPIKQSGLKKLINLIVLTYKLINIIKENAYGKPKAKTIGTGKIKMSKSSLISPEINLLGLTVDEAISRLDKYLDDAYISKLPQVRIVHGKGTGALRNGVTSYLKGVSYIKSFRLGEIGEGDSGVTIVEFK